LWLLARRERKRFGPRAPCDRNFAIVAGVFFAVDLILWHHAIGSVGAGLATVLGNTQVLLVALLAWVLLRERPGTGVLASIPVVLLGIVLLSGVIGDDAFGNDPLLGTVFGVGTGLAYSGFLLTLRRGGADIRRPAGPLFEATLVSALVTAVFALAIGTDLAPTWPAHGWLVVLALTSQVVGWLLISISLPRLPAALTSVLLTVQPVGSVFLGMLLLDESPSALQLLGVALILSGIVTSTWGRKKAGVAASGPTIEAGLATQGSRPS
jgi:drug/metabolite transporter (DMT)-like permease